MIIFQYIKWKNFLSTGNYWNEIQLDAHDLTILIGKNGAGKSTVLDALSFVLYGKPFRETKKKADIVNSVTKKNCVVEVLFSINNDEYKIIRGMNPAKFEIYKNDVLIPQNAKVADYQFFLETEILRCNHKAFCQVVVLGSASYVPFMDLKTPERRVVVENILDLEIFTTMRKVLLEESKETEKQIANLEAERTLVQDRITIAKREINKQETESQKDLESYRKPIAEAEKREAEILFDLESIGILEDKFTPGIEKLTQKRINLNQQKWSLQQKYEEYNQQINFYENNDDCPTCRQKISEQFKLRSVMETQELKEELNKNIDIISGDIDSIDKRIKLGREYLHDYNLKCSRKRDLERELISIQNNKIMWQNLLEEKKESSKKIDTSYIDALKLSLNELSSKLDILYEEREAQKNLKRMLADDGVKANVISDNIEDINALINEYLMKMEFLCQFTMDNEFEETIKSRYRDTFGFGSFSEGEKLRITLSILFAWRDIAKKRNSIDTNIIIFDEILDSSLDAEGVDSFIDIIKRLTKGTNCFIISHNENSIQKIENCIKFEKINGFSRIVGE